MDVIYTLDKIKDAAAALLKNEAGRNVIAFDGPMGSGKTTFIHAICDCLGITGHVGSPSFSIINEYHTSGNELVYHLDLYRLKDLEEAIQAGVEEVLHSGNLCLVEWPGRAPGLFPDDTLYVKIEVLGSGVRKLKFNL